MTHRESFDAAFARCPLVAILRGVQPHEAEAIGDALLDAGFTIVEVPLNSPDPYESITRLSKRLEGYAVVGAGTVLTVEQVEQVEAAGGTLIISPNANTTVISAAAERGLVAMPGIATPTEAFAALDAGAAALKLFPAEAASPAVMKAMRAVLPLGVRMLPVGGIVPSVLDDWHKAGAAGYGLGSALYVPKMDAATVGERARAFVAAWNALEG
ncbi:MULTISPECIES: 2-dehydro-3-deoxy-6-phosphogalactonate aldolase [unclassified Sphingomonas]|uniref:2-dehydro-3-deoxy-6-phosphogalactonate aldolase n=1 Tax=unclassified Sphingomonas TaxID=196159 RepID=UPI0006FA83C2|nr:MULTISPECIES: 2-dehydro-3-deoxy-6-phosphogalactonate aldolase [unclassified Sphingomonas]KQM57865.1 2-dehydro-3-deoxy-6-phosphogalactonate aldolase [Sphingomonas sp. Leaf16]KQN12850.1 2-dehydro-3-deoxy-6-phosphogalactonate aldolase [Sphingomonas sp. Leaf29]KQN19737.1 2-dehydro-3-deoxy-6-phosphogalactonate aldolase [Sphingomonas sp. Leaf32]